MIVWLWDASGLAQCASGVSIDRARAQEAARACLTAGHATTAVVQAAELVDGPDVLDAYYDRFGRSWQARRTRAGGFRWRPLPAPGGT